MDRLDPPQPLQLQGNVAEHWKRFKRMFEIYRAASGLDTKQRKVQSMTFLHVVGPEAVEVYHTFQWAEGECGEHCDSANDFHTYACMLQKFEQYCEPRKNVTIERHVFFTRNQKAGETFDVYLTDLKLKAKSCEFGQLKDSLIKDRLVGGILSDQVRGRLLREADLTLKKAEDICRAAEATEAQLKLMNEEQSTSVNAVKHRNKEKPSEAAASRSEATPVNCRYCGKTHQRRKCPAYGQVCNKCKKKNHFASVCQSAAVQAVEEDDSQNFSIIGTVEQSCDENAVKEWKSTITIGKHRITFTLDTGAQVNVLPMSLYRRLQHGPLQYSSAKLSTYSGESLPVKGKCRLTCVVNTKKLSLEFQVVDTHSKAVLGLSACVSLGLVQRVDMIEDDTLLSMYADVFKGLGCMEDEYTISTDHSVRPVVHASRKVPAALRDDLQKELQRMLKEGVIEKVDYPTDWVNSLVIVEKKGGGLRLCLDPRDLNKAIRREHYQLPTIEEIASRLSGNSVFSVVDASSAFWQIKLDKQSADLTTFNTPFGRFRFLRLPFGLNSSAEVFAKRFHQAFENIPGVETYMDEMLIAGKTTEEHDSRLKTVLERARQVGVKLKLSKCTLRVNEVNFVGHTITGKGLKPDDSKIAAIQQMPTPSCRKDLERFLGMVNYLGKFVPNLSSVSAPLRDLMKQDNEWDWLKQHQDAFEQLKNLVTAAPILVFYDPSKPVTLSVDASQEGLGAVLLHDDKPIAFASRSLTDCEKRYAQIEKELLAVVFGVEHFHYYVYGRAVTVESDHKPLESIIQKPLSAAPPRLQRMLLRTMKYNITLLYKAGREMYVSDTLSRAPLPIKAPASDDWEAQVHLIVSSLPVSDEKLKIFKEATANDQSMQNLRKFIREGFPHKKEIPEDIRAYLGFQDELSEADGLLFKGEQIIVPNALRREMLMRVHEGHLGRDKSLAAAKEVIFWPGMSSQIKQTVANCSVCGEFQNAQQKEPLIPHEEPSLPWEKLGTDILDFNGKQFLILVDYYSKYFEVGLLQGTTGPDIITQLKSHFARYGIPKQLISDNGPQFSCSAFAKFAETWGFQHTTSSPRYSQANGLAERSVQTMKDMLKKAQASGQDPYIALLQYRNTPFPDSFSPAQLLMNRRLRTTLPVTDAHLTPCVPDQTVVQRAKAKTRERQVSDYNKSARPQPRPTLHPGDNVRMQTRPDSTWRPATVVAAAPTPRSYVVRTPEGATFRRNSVMLRRAPETSVQPDTEHSQHESVKDTDQVPIQEDQSNQPVKSQEQSVTVTRSGREVRLPARYKED
ncbi:hypothetical protein V1264_011443 [Littorina saxatilis]|uniref:Endonuclease n=1 Tax=Littorina saxatilis TaxID=31220 RepID=A0AAN9GMB9_9CAEN